MATPHTPILVDHWRQYISLLPSQHQTGMQQNSSSSHSALPLAITIDGNSLSLALVVVASRYPTTVQVDESSLRRCADGAKQLTASLAAGQRIYAANTGVGGSAGARPKDPQTMQPSMLRMLNCGVLTPRPSDGPQSSGPKSKIHPTIPAHEHTDPSALPRSWVRASMLLRLNSLAAGYSAVRPVVLQRLAQLLNADLLPRTPLRGSISASGDLIPLSYIASAMARHAGVNMMKTGTGTVPDDDTDASSFHFAPREAIALVNGTATSTAAAAEMIHRAHLAAALAQILTALNVESLHGSTASFDEFIGLVRPHVGQVEVARTIRGALAGSQMVQEAVGRAGVSTLENDDDADAIYPTDPGQDRYALRTAAQWLGPAVSALSLAHAHVATEINGVTDNPLLRPASNANGAPEFIQGGNFQSSPGAAAMDLVRGALHGMGRLLFQQLTELMHPPTSRGLPPNLTAAAEPSSDFLFKGADIAAASYVSELAYLERGVGPCVQVAEQGNQSVNALALLSARLTSQALDVFDALAATALVAACQALDLRTVAVTFAEQLAPVFIRAATAFLASILAASSTTSPNDLATGLLAVFQAQLRTRAHQAVTRRFAGAMKHVAAAVRVAVPAEQCGLTPAAFDATLAMWVRQQVAMAERLYLDVVATHRPEFTQRRIGAAARCIHRYLRAELEVPFLRGVDGAATFVDQPPDATIGGFISRVVADWREGTGLAEVVVTAVVEANQLVASTQDTIPAWAKSRL